MSRGQVFTLETLTRVVDHLAARTLRQGVFYLPDLDLFALAVKSVRLGQGEAEAELADAEYSALLHQVVPGLHLRLEEQPEAGEVRLLLAVALNRCGFTQAGVDLLFGGLVRNPECTVIPAFLDELMGESSNESVARAAVLAGAQDSETLIH